MPSILRPISGTISTSTTIGPTIKSIQRGIASGAATFGGGVTVSINQVDPTKCIVSVEQTGYDVYYYSTANFYQYMGYTASLTSTALTIGGAWYLYASNYYSRSVVWQIVEYV